MKQYFNLKTGIAFVLGAAVLFSYYQYKMYKAKGNMKAQGLTDEQISSFCK